MNAFDTPAMSAPAWLQALARQHAHHLDTTPMDDAWRRFRAQAMQRVAAAGLPGAGDEHWRHLRFDPSRLAWTSPLPRSAAPDIAPTAIPVDALRLVLVDGVLDPTRSSLAALTAQPGLRLRHSNGRDAAGLDLLLPRLRQLAVAADQRAVPLNQALMSSGLWLTVAPGAKLEAPLYIQHLHTRNLPAYPLLMLDLGDDAELTLIEQVDGANGVAVQVVHATLAPGARLAHTRWVETRATGTLLHQLQLQQQARSDYTLTEIASGTGTVRTTLDARLAGEAADFHTRCIALPAGHGQYDFSAAARHEAPRTRSSQQARYTPNHHARAIFDSQVIVAAGANGAQAQQSCRALLLSPRAEVVSRPQMELYHDDVDCKHGSSVGQLDPEALFYCAQRGMSPAAAQRLLVHAFVADLLPPAWPAALLWRFDAALDAALDDRSPDEGEA